MSLEPDAAPTPPAIPAYHATLGISAVVIALAFIVTLIVLVFDAPTPGVVGLIVGAWLTTALGNVVSFWTGASVGGRAK